MFLTSRFALALGLGAIPVAVASAAGAPWWGVALAWVSACAAGAAVDVGLAANARKVEVIRRAPVEALKGQPLELGLMLQNLGARRLRGTVRDGWPANAQARFGYFVTGGRAVQSSAWGRLELAPGERIRVPLTLTPKKHGELHSHAVVVRALGPLGLAGRQTHHTLPGTVRVLRAPWGRPKALPAAPTPGGMLANALADALQGEDGGSITGAIAELRDLAAVYGSREHLEPGDGAHPVIEAIYEGFMRTNRNGVQPDYSARILPLTEHVADLFVRVRQRGTEQQMRLLISQYRDTLAKLTKALAGDYYGDILRNPHYWSNAEERVREVQLAVEAVDLQAVENIKQLNESRDLEFKVALDSLIRTINEAKLSDVYGERERGADGDPRSKDHP